MPAWDYVAAAERTCVRCGSAYQAKRVSAKYCSQKCKRAAQKSHVYNSAQTSEQYRRRCATRPGYRESLNTQGVVRLRAMKDWIDAYKVERGCIDCGYNAHPVALEFDHMNGKTRNISQLRSITAVQAEIERHDCVIRCSNCHRIKSFETRAWERRSTSESTR